MKRPKTFLPPVLMKAKKNLLNSSQSKGTRKPKPSPLTIPLNWLQPRLRKGMLRAMLGKRLLGSGLRLPRSLNFPSNPRHLMELVRRYAGLALNFQVKISLS
jgi:hypothetical protein